MSRIEWSRLRRSAGLLGRTWARGAFFGAALLVACTSKELTLGKQCPKPGSPGSSVAKGAGTSLVYGTSCAPCAEGKVSYDANGCPKYVTWQSCGGDICIGTQLIEKPVTDAGPTDGGEADGNVSDGGASDGGSSDGGDASHEEEDGGR